jgi:hypothetical protein
MVDEIVVATTDNATDAPIMELAERLGVACFRGSEEDVLDRVLKAARSVAADIIVELTGDCPLIDPGHIDKLVGIYLENDYDYVSNVVERSFPDGFDIQVFSTDLLSEVAALTSDPVDRSHVSYYIYTETDKGIDGALKVASDTGSGWTTTVVDDGDGGNVGLWSALSIDPLDDSVHIAYQDAEFNDLVVATGIPGTWTSELVDDSDYRGADNEVVFINDASF